MPHLCVKNTEFCCPTGILIQNNAFNLSSQRQLGLPEIAHVYVVIFQIMIQKYLYDYYHDFKKIFITLHYIFFENIPLFINCIFRGSLHRQEIAIALLRPRNKGERGVYVEIYVPLIITRVTVARTVFRRRHNEIQEIFFIQRPCSPPVKRILLSSRSFSLLSRPRYRSVFSVATKPRHSRERIHA